MTMARRNRHIIKKWTGIGFLFGIAMNFLNWNVFYRDADGPVIHILQSVLGAIAKPSEWAVDYCVPIPHIYLLVVGDILMLIVQWTVIGTIIGLCLACFAIFIKHPQQPLSPR